MNRENYRYLTGEQLSNAIAEYERILQNKDENGRDFDHPVSNGLRKEYTTALSLARAESEHREKAVA